MSSSMGWVLFLLGIIQLGNGVQERVRHREGRVPAGSPTPISSFLLGFGLALLGILSILADRGVVPFWLYVAPILLAGAGLIRTFFELSESQRTVGAPAPLPSAPEPLTAWERNWKIVSIVLSIVALIAGLIEVGTWAGARTAVVLAAIFVAVWIYLSYYKKKHGHPWGSGQKTV